MREELDNMEGEVRVCDICGDEGEEEMLAVCNRCHDGAEHIYCMREMLDEVPSCNWLCEECELKEIAEKQRQGKDRTVTAAPEEPFLNENTGGALSPKLLPELVHKAGDTEVNKASEITLCPSVPSKRHFDADSFNDSSKSRRTSVETGAGEPAVGSLEKKPSLSQGGSFNSIDDSNAEPTNLLTSSGSQCTCSSKDCILSHSQLDHDSSKILPDLISRLVTYKNERPKVKKLCDDAFLKQNLPRESNKFFTGKEGLISKNGLMRISSSGSSNMNGPKVNRHSSYLSGVKDPSGLKKAELEVVDRETSLDLDPLLIDSSPATGSILSLAMAEALHDSRESNSNGLSDDFRSNMHMVKMPTHGSVIAKPLRTAAIPEFDCLWQGDFRVQGIGNLTNYCGGIQAHVSSCASRRVCDVVDKFPCIIRLEEVPRLSLWPSQFQGKATENNIALYFFARDFESYKNNYKILLDNMVKNDLALKGNVDRIEVLIFPSNQLPETSQRWNRLFFLWALFIERAAN